MNLNKLNFTQKYGKDWEEPYYEAHPLVPKGFMVCDGSRLDVNRYAELFEVIGRSYDDVKQDYTTFPIPDMRAVISGQPPPQVKPGDVAFLIRVKPDPTPSPAGTMLPIGTVVQYRLRQD